jgi:hypothetical protein
MEVNNQRKSSLGKLEQVNGVVQWRPPVWIILFKLYIYKLLIETGWFISMVAGHEKLDNLLYKLKLEKLMGKKSKYVNGWSRDNGTSHSHHNHTTSRSTHHLGGNKFNRGNTYQARIPMPDVPKDRKVKPGHLPKPGNLNKLCTRCRTRRVGDNRFGDCDFCKYNKSVSQNEWIENNFWSSD